MGKRRTITDLAFAGRSNIWGDVTVVAATTVTGQTGIPGQFIIAGSGTATRIYLCISTALLTSTTTVQASNAGSWVWINR